MATTRKQTRSEQAKTTTVRARIDPDLKAEAESILDTLGLNATDAIRLFYTQITLANGLPFSLRVPNATTREAARNARAGEGLVRHESFDEFAKVMKGK